MLCGGTGDVKAATEEVQAICDQVLVNSRSNRFSPSIMDNPILLILFQPDPIQFSPSIDNPVLQILFQPDLIPNPIFCQ